MHPSAMDLGRLLFETHGGGVGRVLDIGSLDVNGSLRDVCPPGIAYVGIDMEHGRGVDLVLDDPYQFPFAEGAFDMIVSSSCFEHDPMFWLTFLETLRVLREGGILYINAPANGHYHTHPLDNWRFYPDAGHALEMWGRRSGHAVHLLESFTMTRCGPWNDYVMVFTKGAVDPAGVTFLSDQIPGVTNLRKIGVPTLLFYTAETDDLRHMAALQARVAALEARVGS
jgi:SAM-dependent methyltransferase